MAKKHKPTSQKVTGVRLMPEDQEIVLALQKKLGLDFTSLVRMALRRLADQEATRKEFAAD